MSKRKRYTDDFRASAVLMLEAAGYPEQRGALTSVAERVRVPARTLSRWFNKEQNPAPDNLVTEKKFDLIQAIRDEIQHAIGDMPEARPDASYRDLTTSVAILIDKLQLLEGKPTERTEVLDPDARRERIAELFETARVRRTGEVTA